jgi:Yip1 domain
MKNEIKNSINLIKNFFINPNDAWIEINECELDKKSIFLYYVIPFCLAAFVLYIANSYIFSFLSSIISASINLVIISVSLSILPDSFNANLFNELIRNLVFILAIFVFGYTVKILLTIFNGNNSEIKSIKFAAFSVSPMFISNILNQFIELNVVIYQSIEMSIITILGIIYSFRLMLIGATSILELKSDRDFAFCVIAVFLLVLILWVLDSIIILPFSM